MIHVTSLLLGLGNGAVFAALAIALVLTYRSSGVVNFATGTMAVYTAYTYAYLRDGKLLILIPGLPTSVSLGHTLGFVPAALIALVIAAAVGALLYAVVFRPLRQAPQLARAVASLGVLVVLMGLIENRVGQSPVSVSPVFPAHRWQWGSITLLSDRFYIALTIVGLALGLTALYRWTRFGLLTRAVAETQTGAIVSGVSPERIALLNWMVERDGRGRGRHLDRADQPVDARGVHPRRCPCARGGSRRPLRVAHSLGGRGNRDRHVAIRVVDAFGPALVVPAHRFGGTDPARRHHRCAARDRPRNSRARRRRAPTTRTRAAARDRCSCRRSSAPRSVSWPSR